MVEGRQWFLFVMVMTTNVLYGGIIFGWIPINEAFITTGIYDWLCDAPVDWRESLGVSVTNSSETASPKAPCEAQIAALNNVFNSASGLLMLVTLPIGMLVDATSPRAVTPLAALMAVAGLLMIAFAKTVGPAFDMLLFGTILMSSGGVTAAWVNFQIAYVADERQNTFITGASCAFTASAGVGPILRFLVDNGVPLFVVFCGLAALSIPVFVASIVAWNMNHAHLLDVRQAAKDEMEEAINSGEALGLTKLTVCKQLCTWEFLLITTYAVLLVMKTNLYLGTVDLLNAQVAAQLGQPKSVVATVSQINGVVIALAFVLYQFIDWTLERFGVFGCLQISIASCVCFSVLQFIPDVYFQVVTCLVVSLVTASFYTYLMAYSTQIFGPLTSGRTTGACVFVAGLSNFTLTPIITWAMGMKTFSPMNVIMLAACFPMPFFIKYVEDIQPVITVEASEGDSEEEGASDCDSKDALIPAPAPAPSPPSQTAAVRPHGGGRLARLLGCVAEKVCHFSHHPPPVTHAPGGE